MIATYINEDLSIMKNDTVKTYRRLIIRTNFILSKTEYMDEYVEFLKNVEDDEIDFSEEIKADTFLFRRANHNEVLYEMEISLPPSI